MTETRATDVTVVGTGLMGTAIARVLLASGRSVTVWNRTATKTQPLAADGALVANTVADAYDASPVAILVVTGVEQVRELWNQAADQARRPDLITLTTCQPDEADMLAGAAASAGLDPLNGAIMAYPEDIGGAEARIFVSGSTPAWAKYREMILELAGGSQYLGPELRLCSVADNIVLYQSMSLNVASLEAAAYAQALGVEPEAAFRMLGDSRESTQGFLTRASAMVDRNNFATRTATVDTWEAAAAAIVANARSAGLSAHMIEAARAAMRQAKSAGHGADDLAAVFATARRRASPA